MKIAHLLGWYFPDGVGGTEVYVEALCRRLRAAGHELRIAAPDAHRAAPERYVHDGVQVFRYAIADSPTRDEAHHRIVVRGGAHLHRWLADERPDILHVHSFTTGVGLPDIREARRLGIRVIVTCHLPGFAYMCRTGELMRRGRVPCDGVAEPAKCAACSLTRLGLTRPLAELAGVVPVMAGRLLGHVPGRIGTALGMSASVAEYGSMQRELFGLVERFVVLNETGWRMLVSNGSPASKLALNRLGHSHADAVAKPAPDVQPTRRPVRFGYLGRLHPSKGLTELARAASSIPPQVDFTLKICGPALDVPGTRYLAELRTLVAGDPRVTFVPAVASTDVPAALAALDALVIPSTCFENGPTVALEAMAVGTPIVASRVGNLAEIIDDQVSGRLVEAGDWAGLAAVMRDIASDPSSTLDAWRRRLPKPRTMDDVAADYLALYADRRPTAGADDRHRTDAA